MGNCINALFAGPLGTGKTIAAQILACGLGLDRFRIDLVRVVSNYVGETEKNLTRIFHMTQAGNSIQLFDESDALFGKRSDVKDAHDPFANIESKHLVQSLEDCCRFFVLTSNLHRNLDEAFTRSMQLIVEFPFPGAAHRARIWERAFPAQAPLGTDVDCGFLGRQFEMIGGNIRNAALAAASMAAERAGLIEMRQVILAAAREFEKMGKVSSRSDFQHYYDLICSENF